MNNTIHETLLRQLVSSLDEIPLMDIHWMIYVAFGAWLCSYAIHVLSSPSTVKVPFAGYRSVFEPTWLLRLRFVWEGGSIISQGYNKVSCPFCDYTTISHPSYSLETPSSRCESLVRISSSSRQTTSMKSESCLKIRLVR